MADQKLAPRSAAQPGGGKPDSRQAGQAGGAKVAPAVNRDTLTDALRRFEDAHINYQRELRDACAEAQQSYQRANQQQVHAFFGHQPHDPSKPRANEAQQESFSPEDVRKRFEEAYRNHLRAIKDAWAKVDVDAIDFGSSS